MSTLSRDREGAVFYWHPSRPLVKQMDEVGGGGIGKPRAVIRAIRSFSASGCGIAD